MLRNLLSTTASRLIIAIINLCIIWISARYLGAEVLGTISLIILGISIIQLVTAILAGSSLVYQTSRHSLAELMIIAWMWIIIAGTPVWFILNLLALIPAEFSLDVLLLSFLGSLVTVNQNVFLGKEKINLFNGMAILQSIIVLAGLLFFVFVGKYYEAEAYVYAQYISLSLLSILGILFNLPFMQGFRIPRMQVITEAFKYGGYLQAASIMQLFNYRLSYYLIEKFFNRATLGIFSVGVQIAESVWIISKSMAVLLYSRLSNNREKEYSINLTLNFIKITCVLTILAIGIIVLLPEKLFILIFRSEFGDLTQVVSSLSIGILAVSVSLMFSHYFSGTGKPIHNTISSGIGLVFTVVLGFTLIPAWGLVGAGVTASISYLGSMIYQFIVFKHKTGVLYRSFVPTGKDFVKVKEEIKSLFGSAG